MTARVFVDGGAMASGEEATQFDERLKSKPNEGDALLAPFLGTGGVAAAALGESRRNETTGPRQYCLWRLNPVVGWLNDRMLALFGRHEPPVLAGLPGIAPGETVFVLSVLVPSRKSRSPVHEWVGVRFRGGGFDSLAPFDEVLERPGLNRGRRTAASTRVSSPAAIADDTLSGRPVERTIEYHAPFDRYDREADYEAAKAAFRHRLETGDGHDHPND